MRLRGEELSGEAQSRELRYMTQAEQTKKMRKERRGVVKRRTRNGNVMMSMRRQ